MSKRDDKLLLEDMVEAAQKIKSYTAGFDFDTFCKDSKTIDAVIRNFEVIGEAANRISDIFKLNETTLEWEKLRGFRNRLIHEYFGVDLEIIESDLDDLILKLSGYSS